MSERFRRVNWMAISSIPIVLIVWQIVVSVGLLSPDVLPSPVSIATRLAVMAGPHATIPWELEKDALATVLRLLGGTAVAFVISIPLGIAIGGSRMMRAIVEPFLSMGLAIPALAMAPLYMLFFGIGNRTDMVVVIIEALVPLSITVSIGFRSLPQAYRWSAQSLGASSLYTVVRVLIPSLTVSIVAGIRQAMGYAWRSLIAVEGITALKYGIGYRAFQAGEFFQTRTIFAEVIIVAVLGILIESVLLRYIETITAGKWGTLNVGR